MSPRTPWWQPDRHSDRRPLLQARGRIKKALRSWFEEQGFVEVDTGALVVSPGNETHLQAFQTQFDTPDGGRRRMYLHTSPEFACKKLLAAGETRIFTFAAAFRNRERGPLHAPEFTMLEWYRADSGDEQYDRIQDDCLQLLKVAANAAGRDEWHWREATCAPLSDPIRRSVRDAVAELALADLSATVSPTGTPDRDRLAESLSSLGWRLDPDETWADMFSKLMVETERRYPDLNGALTADGRQRPFILDRYPAVMSALARNCPDDARFALRFELFACGIELANGFGEENDPGKVRKALELEMLEKNRIYGDRYPIDEDFLEALALMPQKTAGCALGFDRLVMLATGATHIDQVLWTPLSP